MGSPAAAINAAIFGPASAACVDQPGSFAHVDEGDVGAVAARPGGFGEQWRLLRAADSKRAASRGGGAKSAQSRRGRAACGLDLGAAAAAPHGVGIERHRVVARAQKNVFAGARSCCRT